MRAATIITNFFFIFTKILIVIHTIIILDCKDEAFYDKNQ